MGHRHFQVFWMLKLNPKRRFKSGILLAHVWVKPFSSHSVWTVLPENKNKWNLLPRSFNKAELSQESFILKSNKGQKFLRQSVCLTLSHQRKVYTDTFSCSIPTNHRLPPTPKSTLVILNPHLLMWLLSKSVRCKDKAVWKWGIRVCDGRSIFWKTKLASG